MKKSIFQSVSLVLGIMMAASCQEGSIGHIGSTKLVILQKIPVIEDRFDENFNVALELLYPHECHDTVFIQDQVFLERIDLNIPFKRELAIPPSLLRDFFGSNNPDKKKALREDLFFRNDSSFEKHPDKQFLTDSEISRETRAKVIGAYLARNRNNTLVYLASSDTLCKTYLVGGTGREVLSDFARLNCRIVEDLKKKTVKELANTTVIILLIPPESIDSSATPPPADTRSAGMKRPVSIVPAHPADAGRRSPATAKPNQTAGSHAMCPPDSVVEKVNKQHAAIITEFRNLLHYIATTTDDADLKHKYREDAFAEIHKIPRVRIEGIPEHDLRGFLNSGFTSRIVVTPVADKCGVITGVRVGGQ